MQAADRLTLMQWMSPAFPTGAYAYSHGLEAEIGAGRVSDGPALSQWLADVMQHGSGRCDAVLLAAGLSGNLPLPLLDQIARALCPGAERLAETLALGTAFLRATCGPSAGDVVPLAMPVAVALRAQTLDLPHEDILAAYLQSMTSNLVLIGVRFIPIGQGEGQQILSRLQPMLAALSQDLTARPPPQDEAGLLDRLQTAALGADLSSLEHETQDVRLFRT